MNTTVTFLMRGTLLNLKLLWRHFVLLSQALESQTESQMILSDKQLKNAVLICLFLEIYEIMTEKQFNAYQGLLSNLFGLKFWSMRLIKQTFFDVAVNDVF